MQSIKIGMTQSMIIGCGMKENQQPTINLGEHISAQGTTCTPKIKKNKENLKPEPKCSGFFYKGTIYKEK